MNACEFESDLKARRVWVGSEEIYTCLMLNSAPTCVGTFVQCELDTVGFKARGSRMGLQSATCAQCSAWFGQMLSHERQKAF